MIYVTLTFLAQLLVLQPCFAIPKPDAESPASHHEFNTDNKLYKATLEAFVKTAIPLGEQYGNVLEKVLEDLKAHEEAANYETQIEHLEELVKGAKHLKGDSDDETLRNILKLESDVAGAQEASKKSPNPHLVHDLFEKDGGKEHIEKFHKSVVEFFADFDDSFEEYAKDLSEGEKADHEDFLKWFKEFKEADGFANQFEKFLRFFTFFNPELFKEKRK
ncbi:uncharacterized protein LOC119633924 [Glossina fuscipes]|uniref:Uncharacterized protein LOC119633924 n=1 Tax=Glossina fuscipes TaxID=7396 RepID=A0A8U0WE21_9MUSC|nr:uncharacterized protein LOC119633924 [Glossina fuscipes]